jgi:hypothetical protein
VASPEDIIFRSYLGSLSADIVFGNLAQRKRKRRDIKKLAIKPKDLH